MPHAVSDRIHSRSPFQRPAIEAQASVSRAHQYLAREGDLPQYLHLLIDGWAARYKLLPDGRRQILNLYLPGDLCDPAWFMFSGQISYPVTALSSLKTLRVARRDAEREAANNPDIMAAFWLEIQVSAAIREEWILNLGRKNALERLAHFFCETFYRLEQSGQTASGACDMPLTQIELADISGLTPVHVNRVLQDMRTTGLIELQGRRLRIPDMDRLARLAFFHPGYLMPATRARLQEFIRAAAA